MLSNLTLILSILLVITCVHAHKDNIFRTLHPLMKKVEKKPIQLKVIDIKPIKAEKTMEVEPVEVKMNSSSSKEDNGFNDLEEAMLKELKKLERY